MFKYFVAASAVAVLAAPAVAADFQGPRIEARAGWDKITLEGRFDDGTDRFKLSDSDEDVGYGAELGYDGKFGSTTLGVYAGVDLSSVKQCDELFGLDELCLKTRRNFTLGVRSGFIASDRALLYVKGGYSNGRVRATYEDFEDILPSVSDAKSRSGFHVGAGVELAVSSKAYVKAEYVHTNYKAFNLDDDTKGDFSRDQVFAGVGFRF